jgi:glycosyltransferase involved in cell wall biosynthesis
VDNTSIFLVVPCYNEASRWNEKYWAKLSNSSKVSIVFVDDGSSDSTLKLLKSFCNKFEASYLSLEKNFGKAEAIRQGWLSITETDQTKSEKEYIVGFVDADGAVSVQDILRLVEIFKNLRGFDALWSSRVALAGRQINRRITRHYLGRIFASIASIGIESIPYDTQSGFKLFGYTREFEECIKSPFKTKWLFELEMINHWKINNNRNFKIWEEPLNEWTDVQGSKVTIKEMFRIGKELLKIKLVHTQWKKV